MWRASSFPLLISLLVLTAPSLARADYRAALDYAQARVQDAAAAVDAAQCALDDARARRDAAGAELRQTIDSIGEIEQAASDAQRQLEGVDRALAALERELPARQAARDDAERRSQASAAVVQQIHDEAWAPFSQSPEFVETERAVAREKARADASVEQAHQQLLEDPDYRQLEDVARAAEEYLEALRDDPRADPNERAAASQRWLDAKAAAQRYRDEAVATDPAVEDARAALDEATMRHREMLAAFEASLEADPRLREARERLHADEAALAAADQALRETSVASAAAARDLQNLDAERAAREAQVAQAHARVDELGGAIESLDHDVRRFEHELSIAADALAQAAHERDAAEAAYRDARVRFEHDYGPHRRYDHRERDRGRDYDHHQRDRNRDGHHHKDEDRGKRYERRDPPRSKPEPDHPRDDRRDPPVPQLIDEQERERARREELQQQEDARRALRERREAEWQQRREENRRRQEEVEKSKQQDPPPPTKPAEKREPPPPRQIVIGPPPAPKVGPEPPRREEKKREAKEEPRPREAKKDEPKREESRREEPRKTERKDGSSNDRGDRYRKGK